MGLTRDDRGVVTCTVDDAPTRNALGTAALRDIDRVLADVAADPSVRVLVFTGAGTVFSSGADRSELGDPALIESSTRLLTRILTRIDESPVPVVGRVNGAAIGAGLAIAAAADIAIATEDAFFVLPEVRFGLVPGPAAAACVARMGQTAGLDLMLTGRRFAAAEAARLHLIARVVPRDELDAAVGAVVTDLLAGDAAALAATRRLVRRLGGPGLGERLRIDGVVEHGDHRGRTLGFPTANLNVDRSAAVPADGIYAGRALALDEWWQADESATLGAAAISVGTNPTFGRHQRRVEAHILDFDGDLYGRRIGIEFTTRLRGMIKFGDPAALVAQLKLDVAQARAIQLA